MIFIKHVYILNNVSFQVLYFPVAIVTAQLLQLILVENKLPRF